MAGIEEGNRALDEYAKVHGLDSWRCDELENGRWRVVLFRRQEFGGDSRQGAIEQVLAHNPLAAREEPVGEADDREWHGYGEQFGLIAGRTTWTGPTLKAGERVTVVPKSRLAAREEPGDGWGTRT